jgi:integrase/recombinase XerD
MACYMMRLMNTSRTEPPNKGNRYPAEPLTPAEMAALIGQCSRRAPTGIRNRALITLLYRSGLRVSEVLTLRPADVNLDAHSIRLLDSKSGQAQTRGFHPSADDALLRWMDERKRLGLATNGHKLFCTLAGGPLSDDYVRNMLRRLAGKAGIEKRVHPHGLRHTYAFELEQAGTPVTVISKLLGHSSVAVTARYLDHLTNGQAVAALQAVELPALPAVPPARSDPQARTGRPGAAAGH